MSPETSKREEEVVIVDGRFGSADSTALLCRGEFYSTAITRSLPDGRTEVVVAGMTREKLAEVLRKNGYPIKGDERSSSKEEEAPKKPREIIKLNNSWKKIVLRGPASLGTHISTLSYFQQLTGRKPESWISGREDSSVITLQRDSKIRVISREEHKDLKEYLQHLSDHGVNISITH